MTAAALRKRLQSVPADLLGVVAAVVLTHVFVFHSALSGSAFRIAIGLPFVLLVPGYAFVSAVFPEEGTSPTATGDGTDRSRVGAPVDSGRAIDRWERVALAFGLSLAAVPLVAMAVTLSPLAFGAATVLPAIGVFSILCAGIAAGRRRSLPPQRRFRVSPIDWLARTRRSVAASDSRGELLLSAGLVIAVVLAAGTLGAAVLAPSDGETYTEFYVLTEDAEGELVAADYPDNLQPGESQPLFVGIENYEDETVDYEVVVQLQRVGGTDTNAAVTNRTRIDRYSTTLGHNETQVDERSLIAPEGWNGTDLRLQFLLYEDAVPGTPTRENAHRSLHIWIDVGPAGNTTADGQSSVSSEQNGTDSLTRTPGDDSITATPDGQNATPTPTPTPDDQNTTATPDDQTPTPTPTATPDDQTPTATATPTPTATPDDQTPTATTTATPTATPDDQTPTATSTLARVASPR